VTEQRESTLRRGRRAGHPSTRSDILHVALAQFAESGFSHTSIRTVAAAAHVNPSLVTHFFTSKEGLFGASVSEALAALRSPMIAAITAGREGLGRRLATTYFGFWEQESTSLQLRAIYRSASSSRTATEIVQRELGAAMPPELFQEFPPEITERFPLAMAQLLGVAILRYLFPSPAIADLSLDDLIDAVGPAIEHTLGGHIRTKAS
jgi:AcrR family transcriptional regulator